MTRMLVCVGQTSQTMMRSWLDGGLRLPFHVVTMDKSWFEVAAELGKPRSFFKRKLMLMNFVVGHEIICLEATDKTDERISMGASMYAMGAKSIPIASDVDT